MPFHTISASIVHILIINYSIKWDIPFIVQIKRNWIRTEEKWKNDVTKNWKNEEEHLRKFANLIQLLLKITESCKNRRR